MPLILHHCTRISRLMKRKTKLALAVSKGMGGSRKRVYAHSCNCKKLQVHLSLGFSLLVITKVKHAKKALHRLVMLFQDNNLNWLGEMKFAVS
jgi:hypothetical protein